MSDQDFDFDPEAEAARMFSLIGNPVAEIRAIPPHDDMTRDLAVGLFRDYREFGDAAVGLSSLMGQEGRYAGVYMTVNQLAEQLLSQATATMGKGYGIRDYQITRIRTLFLDTDPTRDHPLGGKVCATDDEHAAALALAQRIADSARSLGWPESLLIDSGSGAYVIF